MSRRREHAELRSEDKPVPRRHWAPQREAAEGKSAANFHPSQHLNTGYTPCSGEQKIGVTGFEPATF